MSELMITAADREDLLGLLEDEDRLRVEHPKVAEYLQTAPGLPGTGDLQADASFDLRLAYYMTRRLPIIDNPYWKIIGPSISYRDQKRKVDGLSLSGSSRLAFAQMTLQDVYAYAIPSPETISWVGNFCDGLPVVELGAGRGYWTAQLREHGTIVDAYDIAPPGQSFASIQPLDEFEPGTHLSPECTLFLCWPPGWGDSMAADALASFEKRGGARLIYIGEWEGGKTASPQFFQRLSRNWELASVDRSFVSWWNLSDQAQGWIRTT